MSLLLTAASGLTAQTARLDAIANNIANLDTAGYQGVGVSFADTLTQVYAQSPALQSLPSRQSPFGLWLGTGVYALPMTRNFAQGVYHATQNPLDMAIQGDGFFMVSLPGNRTGYTRAGAFSAAQGTNGRFFLATSAGYPVLGQNGQPIDLTGINLQTLHVSPTGVLTADTLQGAPVRVGQLGLAYVAHPSSALGSIGQDIYTLNPGYAAVTNANGGAQTGRLIGNVAGSMLEMSNVNLAQQMAGMIKTQHDFNMAAQAVNIADKMMGLANTL